MHFKTLAVASFVLYQCYYNTFELINVCKNIGSGHRVLISQLSRAKQHFSPAAALAERPDHQETGGHKEDRFKHFQMVCVL